MPETVKRLSGEELADLEILSANMPRLSTRLLIGRALAELRAAREREGWRDIKDAPRDQYVRLFCPGDSGSEQRIGIWCKSIDTGDEAWRYASLWHAGEHISILCEPTHFRLLDPPPGQEGKP